MPKGIVLLNDEGIACDAFSVGETVFASGHGLPPLSILTFILEGPKSGILARLSSDRHGSLPMTALVPYLGLVNRDSDQRLLTHDEAERKLSGNQYVIRIGGPDKSRFEQRVRFRVTKEHSAHIFSSDPNGKLLTGLEIGESAIGITLRNFPEGCVRVLAVSRQFGWRIGDPIEPARYGDGRPIVETVRHEGRSPRYVRLGTAEDFGAGSYQFIARPFRPGWFEADELTFLEGDVVSDRRFASLVVRVGMRERFGYDNGVVLTPQISGRPLAHRPYFHFVDNFPRGTDVYAALDPDALPSGLVGTRAAIYVIQHKTSADWTASSSLSDISGPGMTPNVKVVPIVPGCVNWNTTLVWPNPQTTGKYDIVIDFGNNVADPALFATDGRFDPPLDMIDGYVRTGFYVTDDPSLPGPHAGSIGQHDYALGTISVPSTDTGPTPTDSLPLTATLRYPATSSGIDSPVASGAFPLIVMMHGNSSMGTSYLGYNYLLDHLASWGFIAMSIYAPTGVMIETRARAILAHIGIMFQNNANPGLFHSHIDFGNVGIAGHSRGAESVVRAARINTSESLGWNLKAGISIAPTDYNHYGDPGIPLLVIYGANDGDVAGTWPDRTCFNIFDESGRPRSFAFVYGATHDRFNTEWASIESMTELTWDITPSDLPNLISLTDHENVAKGYLYGVLPGTSSRTVRTVGVLQRRAQAHVGEWIADTPLAPGSWS